MGASVTTDQVWREIARRFFAVVGYVTPRGESRTAGIVYVTHQRRLYFGTGRSSWKAKHMARNPAVSMTVTIPKRIPFVPWARIPAATISLHGRAVVREATEIPDAVQRALPHALDRKGAPEPQTVVIEVQPDGDFVTYGVGVSLRTMRDPEASRGRAPVGAT